MEMPSRMRRIKLLFFIICGVIGLMVSLSFTRTMKGILRDIMIERHNSSRVEFNQIFLRKGFWTNPYGEYMQGSGLQKTFTFPIFFTPSLNKQKVKMVSFDLEMTPIDGNSEIKNICDNYLILLLSGRVNNSTGFRISSVRSIRNGWIALNRDRINLFRPVPFTFQSKKKERVTASITPGSILVTIGDNVFSLNGNFNQLAVGFMLGASDTRIQNLEISYSDNIYRDLVPYRAHISLLLLVLIFLIPTADWLAYSYCMSRYFKFDTLKFALSDFPVIFLFLFFNVNPHKTFMYALLLVMFLIFSIRSILFAKFLYHLSKTHDIRKKGFISLTILTAIVYAGIYLLAVFNADKLQLGETFIEKKEISLPVLGFLFLLSIYMFLYYERFNQFIRLATISSTIVIFTAMPKYFRADSYLATADKLFKPDAMYYHYNGMAKTKPIGKVKPGYRRIFFGGGSATYGFPMDVKGKAFPEKFEHIVNREGAGVDVFNIGMLGHTISSLRYSIEKNDLLDKYPIDMLVLYLGFNDASVYPKLYGFIDKTDWQSITYMNYSSLPIRLFRMIQFSPPISYLLLLKSMFIPPPAYRKGNRWKDTKGVPRVSVQEEVEQVTWFSKECRKRKILLIIIPEIYDRTRSLAEAFSRNPQQKAMVNTANLHAIPVIDCYPEFDTLHHVYMYDLVHLNEAGNKKLAEILSNKLMRYVQRITPRTR
jgi:lysophospholipase L1-like esterase